MTRGTTGGTGGSNLPVPLVTYANPSRGRGGHGEWLTSLLPWWGWLGVAIGFMVTFGVGIIATFFQSVVDQGGQLIGLGAVALVVVGVVAAIAGHFLKMAPHNEAFARGHHMVRHGLLGALFGLAIMFGGRDVAWGVGAVVVSDVMNGVRARVNLPAAPAALHVQFPNLASAHSPAPAATPT